MSTIKKKLKSYRGESISETLIALLISAFALVMLAGAITSASNVITTSRKKLKAYYDQNEADDGVVQMIPPSENPLTGTVTITDDSNTLETQNITITYFVNDEFSQIPVISYKK